MLFKYALKALTKYKLKTFLMFIASMVSIASIFLITAVSGGIISMYSAMLKTGGDIIVTQKDISDTFFSDVNRTFATKVAQVDGVKNVYAIIVGACPVNSIPICAVYGVGTNYYSHYKLTNGTYPNSKEVIIGSNIAKTLKNPTKILISGKEFKVSGVFESQIGFEQGGVVVPIDDGSLLFHKSASFLLVSLKQDMAFNTIKNNILDLNNSDIDVKTTQSFTENYNQFKIIRTSSYAVSFMAFLLGLIGISSMMSMIVNERKGEFGIMRAIGITQSRIILGLCIEVIILITVSFMVAWLTSEMILFILENIQKFQGYISGKISFEMLLGVFVSSILMGLLGAIFPAWMASKSDPAELIQKGAQ